eukprot:scaffold4453_cov124-Pinguiococcus_pyrenoidosus.AAC.1
MPHLHFLRQRSPAPASSRCPQCRSRRVVRVAAAFIVRADTKASRSAQPSGRRRSMISGRNSSAASSGVNLDSASATFTARPPTYRISTCAYAISLSAQRKRTPFFWYLVPL